MGSRTMMARVHGVETVYVARSFLDGAGKGDVLVNVASTAGHGCRRS